MLSTHQPITGHKPRGHATNNGYGSHINKLLLLSKTIDTSFSGIKVQCFGEIEERRFF